MAQLCRASRTVFQERPWQNIFLSVECAGNGLLQRGLQLLVLSP